MGCGTYMEYLRYYMHVSLFPPPRIRIFHTVDTRVSKAGVSHHRTKLTLMSGLVGDPSLANPGIYYPTP
jgi:hypothetical protein